MNNELIFKLKCQLLLTINTIDKKSDRKINYGEILEALKQTNESVISLMLEEINELENKLKNAKKQKKTQ
ncbi:hypothetical protein [Tenacibaculum maritimum]|uniref:hypothetical protein n=1 Tax=Tenacibaculum maritimum TaxID=107401 RepID=UPI0012E409AC|nr:hypothetical protein [Tenacibaculum maritimum]CAA0215502.1 hypothetical protein TMP139_380002 [Tenacibaculum maritimum]